MKFIWTAVFLLGFIHAGGKLILELGLNTLQLCLSFVGIRLLFQLIVNFKDIKDYKVLRSIFWILLAFGFIGAGLQYFEYKGLEEGLGVATVSFLVYSHPIWSASFAVIRKQAQLFSLLPKLFLALVGISLITGFYKDFQFEQAMVYPLLGGFFLALWVLTSKVAAEKKIPPKVSSFYYDFYTFIFLALVFSRGAFFTEVSAMVPYFLDLSSAFMICGYSLVIGYLPNVLYYKGNESVKSALAAGYILLLEPVLSGVYSYFLFEEKLSGAFFIGAALILAIQLGKEQLLFLRKKLPI